MLIALIIVASVLVIGAVIGGVSGREPTLVDDTRLRHEHHAAQRLAITSAIAALVPVESGSSGP